MLAVASLASVGLLIAHCFLFLPQGKILLKGHVCCLGEELCGASTDLCLVIDVPSPDLVLLYVCL